jgi:hypothetical protein
LLGWCTRSHHPKYDEESEKAKYVKDHSEAFEDRHLSDGVGVEQDSAQNVSHGEQCTMPALNDKVW